MNPVKVILVRHGVTDWNEQGRRLGSTDIPLNSVGQRQAQELREALAFYPVQVIYHSGLQRSLETAQIIAQSHPSAELRVDPRFRERSHGIFEGTSREVADGMDTTSLLSSQEQLRQGIEPMQAVWERVTEAYGEVRTSVHSGAIVIVSHYAPIRLILAYVQGYDLEWRKHVQADPGSVATLSIEPEGDKIVSMNSQASALKKGQFN